MKLRGSADFESIAAYQALIDRLNCYSITRFQEEQKALQPLPTDDFIDFTQHLVMPRH